VLHYHVCVTCVDQTEVLHVAVVMLTLTATAVAPISWLPSGLSTPPQYYSAPLDPSWI